VVGLLLAACGGSEPSPPPLGSLPEDATLTAHDVAGPLGLAQPSPIHTWSAGVADVDADERPDVLLVRHLVEPGSLYRNTGGRFREIAKETFVMRDRHFCAFADANADGRIDVFCSLGADRGTGAKTDELWIQGADGGFTDRAAAFGVTDPYGRGRFAVFFDANHDALPDLFVGNAAPRADEHPTPNRLFLNEAGRRFRDAPELGLDEETGSFCAQAEDVDRDGWTDLFTCGNEGIRLYRNRESRRFLDVTRAYGLAGRIEGVTAARRPANRTELINNPQPPWRDARLADLDGDRWLDLIAVGEQGLVVQRGKAGGFLAPTVIGTLTAGSALAVADVDGDGRLDVYVLQTCHVENGAVKDDPDVLLHNDGGMRFRRVRLPAAQGCGQAAFPIDADGDGRSEFIVLNGRDRFPGTVEVFRFASS
jgi:hypothetical protein